MCTGQHSFALILLIAAILAPAALDLYNEMSPVRALSKPSSDVDITRAELTIQQNINCPAFYFRRHPAFSVCLKLPLLPLCSSAASMQAIQTVSLIVSESSELLLKSSPDTTNHTCFCQRRKKSNKSGVQKVTLSSWGIRAGEKAAAASRELGA